MPVRLDSSMGPLVLGTWSELCGSSTDELSMPSSSRLQRAIAEQPGASAALRSLLLELGELGLEFVDAHELVERVVALIERGRLRCAVEAWAPMPSGMIEGVERVEAPASDEPEPTAEVQLHWVEIMIVDEDDEGIVGVRCEITLPDGRKRQATTDRMGLIRIDGILDVGDCIVRLPDLDQQACEPA